MDKLIETTDHDRDQHWENEFFNELSTSHLKVLFEEAKTGPDNWPYLLVKTDNEGTEPFQNILHWLITRGIGLVVNPEKQYPDYVFTYGMLWYFQETGLFYSHSSNSMLNTKAEVFKVESQTKVHVGQPDEKFLPFYVRKVLKQFFLDQGILQPKICLLSYDQVNYDLVFSLESLGSPDQKDQADVAEAISWFLPGHYSIAILSEKNIKGFSPI